jgi:FkbM family methyltransferase
VFSVISALRRARQGCELMAAVLRRTGRWMYRSPMEKRCEHWFADQNNELRRTSFPLTAQSLVFDLGGYEGQWASDIFARYSCPVYVFEPVPAFAARIRTRFQRNPAIQVFDFGLAAENGTARLGMSGDASSLYKKQSQATADIRLVDVAQFLKEHSIRRIALMKINIEGGEYDLLERLVLTGAIKCVERLLVQFHDVVPDARARMLALQRSLRETHALEWQFEFVWESWILSSSTS